MYRFLPATVKPAKNGPVLNVFKRQICLRTALTKQLQSRSTKGLPVNKRRGMGIYKNGW
jgi:hypothetical protein